MSGKAMFLSEGMSAEMAAALNDISPVMQAFDDLTLRGDIDHSTLTLMLGLMMSAVSMSGSDAKRVMRDALSVRQEYMRAQGGVVQ
ncbi:hypothetical protein [Limimaricola cinnabarinus]|uniref:hypothetical protein n=1 Tax=Limimaricola cinnabarinus TaxID=1125964 RepID=UPI002493CD4D|nr:hypothetical protein [Limimaricola cinnabarinus]